MQVTRMVSNQWGIGINLHRCTIIGNSRWHFWINHGYGTFSITSKKNGPIRRRWGFKSKKQLPLFMVWDEHWYFGEVEYANIVFSTSHWPLWLPKALRQRLFN